MIHEAQELAIYFIGQQGYALVPNKVCNETADLIERLCKQIQHQDDQTKQILLLQADLVSVRQRNQQLAASLMAVRKELAKLQKERK